MVLAGYGVEDIWAQGQVGAPAGLPGGHASLGERPRWAGWEGVGRGDGGQPWSSPAHLLSRGVWVWLPRGWGAAWGGWDWHGSRPTEGASGAQEAGAAQGCAGEREGVRWRGGEEKGAGGRRGAGGFGGWSPDRSARRSLGAIAAAAAPGFGRKAGGRAGALGESPAAATLLRRPEAAARWVPAPGRVPLGPSRLGPQSRALPGRTLCAGRAAPGSRPRVMKRGP